MATNLIRAQVSDARTVPSVIVLNHGQLADQLNNLSVPTQVFDESVLSTAAIFRKIKAHMQEIRPAIVHTHRQKENVLGAIAAKRCGIASVRTVHGWNEFPALGWKLHKRLFRWLDGFTGRRLQYAIVAVSEELAVKLRSRFPEKSLRVVGNGIDLDAVRAAATPAANLPGAANVKRVGIVARLVPVKRHDRFLAAAEAVIDRPGAEVEFYIVGDGPLGESIEASIAASPAKSKIHLLGFRKDILNVTAALDSLVVCSDHEGVPMSVLEAAALGVSVVSLPLPSIKEIIDSGAKGLLTESNETASLAQAIIDDVNAASSDSAALEDRWPYAITQTRDGYLQAYCDALGREVPPA